MQTVFADSFYFFALGNRHDPVHGKCIAFNQKFSGRLVTTGFVPTDCISFVVMTNEGIDEALTGDHHFEQAGFVALLR